MSAGRPGIDPFHIRGRVAGFLGWGLALAFLQWGVERTAPVRWLTERLADALVYGLAGLVHQPAQVNGPIVQLHGVTQEITPNCFGLVAITFYLAALLATPADWRQRLRGVGLGLVAITIANVVRLVMLSWFFAYASFAFGFVHIPMWGTVVPLFLVGVWGLWLVRDLQGLPRFPLKFMGLVVLFLGPLLAAWYVLVDGYLVALVLTVNALVTGVVGVPIETMRLAAAGILRHLDLGLATGGFRIEVAAQTLSLVPYLALALASPIALGRRMLLALAGVGVLFVLHGAATSILIVLGASAPRAVPPFEVANDFLSLAAAPSLWLLLARPSREWFSGSAGAARDGRAGARQRPRSARNLA